MRQQLTTMRQPIAEGAIAWIVQQRLLSESPAHAFPLRLGARADREIPAEHTKRLVWHAVCDTAASRHRATSSVKKFCDPAHLQCHCRLQHRGHDVLSLTRALPSNEGRKDSWHGERRRVEIDKTNVAQTLPLAPRTAIQTGKTRKRLDIGVYRGQQGQRPL